MLPASIVAHISGYVTEPAPQYCGHLIYLWTFYKLVLLDSSVRCIIHLPIALWDGLFFFCWLSSVKNDGHFKENGSSGCLLFGSSQEHFDKLS
jgi:hypothetical protein